MPVGFIYFLLLHGFDANLTSILENIRFLIEFARGSEKCAIALIVKTYEIYKEMQVNFKQKWFTRF